MTKLKHSPDPNQPINFTDPKQRRNLDRQFEKQRKIIQQLRDYYKPQALQKKRQPSASTRLDPKP
jgi:hypothetical protein